jgi:hypothetical protein
MIVILSRFTTCSRDIPPFSLRNVKDSVLGFSSVSDMDFVELDVI